MAHCPFVVELVVTDTGVGLEEGTRDRLFEPFFTTKEPGKGTGLGLSTVYGIVKQFRGEIEVESQRGQGSTFRIQLPQATGEIRPVALPPAPVSTTGSETVLIAEDEQTIRDLARRILGERGYHVLAAADGERALQLSGDHPGEIQLLLTDLVMPRMGGEALAQNMREQRPGLRVLFMSGYSEKSEKLQTVLRAGDAYIRKPFSPEELVGRIRQVLDAAGGAFADSPRAAAAAAGAAGAPGAPGARDGTGGKRRAGPAVDR